MRVVACLPWNRRWRKHGAHDLHVCIDCVSPRPTQPLQRARDVPRGPGKRRARAHTQPMMWYVWPAATCTQARRPTRPGPQPAQSVEALAAPVNKKLPPAGCRTTQPRCAEAVALSRCSQARLPRETHERGTPRSCGGRGASIPAHPYPTPPSAAPDIPPLHTHSHTVSSHLNCVFKG